MATAPFRLVPQGMCSLPESLPPLGTWFGVRFARSLSREIYFLLSSAGLGRPAHFAARKDGALREYRKMCKTIFAALAAALFVFVPTASRAFPISVPPLSNFQGVATDAAGHRLAGAADLTFKYYDDSAAGTLLLTEAQAGVPLTNGLFDVVLGSGTLTAGAETSFPNVFSNHSAVWIGVTLKQGVLTQTLTPRLAIQSSPYAIHASTADSLGGLFSGAYLTTTSTSQTKTGALTLSAALGTPLLQVDQSGAGVGIEGAHTAATGTSASVKGTTASTDANAKAVFGEVLSTGPGGYSAGVRGQNDGTGGQGIGVYGSHAGSGWGVYGTSASGVGVYADGGSGSGLVAYGATGVSATGSSGDGVDGASMAATGVSGEHIASTGTLPGVSGTTASTDATAIAVYGEVLSTNPGGFSSAVRGRNDGTGGFGIGVYGSQGGQGWGVYGTTPSGLGVYGVTSSGTGVEGDSGSGIGVLGDSSTSYGVWGFHAATTGTAAGVHGETASATGGAAGVEGVLTSSSPGMYSAGVLGRTTSYGPFVYGVMGTTVSAVHSAGVYGQNTSGATFGAGVEGDNVTGDGVYGLTGSGTAVFGEASAALGSKGTGVEGVTQDGIAIHGALFNYTGTPTGKAGVFDGDVDVHGKLTKTTGSFKIDHPLDPANKYLSHSFVESPDMMNIYNGNVTTDSNGDATVILPNYFEALNKDFRYQLTVIGQFAQAIVATKVQDNQFTIKTDKPGVEVSWQVTGIRHDAYAAANPIVVEEMKPPLERGKYYHPVAQGQPLTRP